MRLKEIENTVRPLLNSTFPIPSKWERGGQGEEEREIYKVANVHMRKGHRIHKYTTAPGMVLRQRLYLF